MTNYTRDNHLRYSIGDREFGYRESSFEKYKVYLGAIDSDKYRTSNYIDELRYTADAVYKEFGKDLIVYLSGGTDSEMVVRNFIDIGIRPKCLAIRFKNGYNAPDIAEAEEIAKELDINLEILDFDVIDFYKSGAANELGQSVQCTQVTYLTVYNAILKMGAPAVMGGEVLLTRLVKSDLSNWYYTFRENEDASAMRFSEKYDIPLVNEWFSYTPEMLLYYLEDYGIQNLINTRLNYKLTSVSSKNEILRRLYPNIRPKIKTHGFERLLGFNFEAYKQLASNQIRKLEGSIDGIPMDIAMKMLKGTYDN
jgi:hypothetical protein